MKQQLLQEEIMRINAEVMRAKEKKLEEEKLSDMRDAEFQQKKMVRLKATDEFLTRSVFKTTFCLQRQERQAEYEAEQARIKKEKELEIASLRAKQERAKDHKAEQVRNSDL